MVCTEFPRGLLFFKAPLPCIISLRPPPTFHLSEPGTYLTHYQIHIPTLIHTPSPAIPQCRPPSPHRLEFPRRLLPPIARHPISLMPSNFWVRAFTPISSHGRLISTTTTLLPLQLRVGRSPHVRRSYPKNAKRPRTG